MNLMELTARLLSACEQNSVRLVLEYDTGRYIPGEFFDPKNPDDDSHVVQGKAGWHIQVGNYGMSDDGGNEALYPTLSMAVMSGVRLLGAVMEERVEKEAKK